MSSLKKPDAVNNSVLLLLLRVKQQLRPRAS